MMTKDRMTEVNRFKAGSTHVPQEHHLRATRFWLGIVMAGLILSGVTAFPLETELHFFLILLRSSALCTQTGLDDETLFCFVPLVCAPVPALG
jgi:hypothetical protein